MLNITKNSLEHRMELRRFAAYGKVSYKHNYRKTRRILFTILVLFIATAFLPWTQTVDGTGEITSLKPEQRPQALHSIIDGRIEKWYVGEGNLVNKGDTLLRISEVKDAYFDPELLPRTRQQIESKKLAVQSYQRKVEALENQINALRKAQDIKLNQAQNKLRQAQLKVQSDSIDFEAAKNNYSIAETRLERAETLYKQDIYSLTDVESRRIKFQEELAKRISAENKLLTSRNEFLNARMELNAIQNDYRNKIAKAESDRFATLSSQYDAEAIVAKTENQYANYEARRGFYYIIAPQKGYVTKAVKTGIGENVKSGEPILTIMPADYQLAAQVYIDPFNFPLLSVGEKVRLVFDGWPALFFSGWPGISTGTFGGKVVAIDNFISPNGKYRILVTPDMEAGEWPQALRVGSGVKAMILLGDVPLGYEIWRRLNGFPPSYYKGKEEQSQNKQPNLKLK